MQEPAITPELIREHGISEDEYTLVCETLGRTPTFTELGIISVMWSEHASYKNSIRWLKTLPREGRGLLTKTGEENAGVVDIGEGLAISFKIESHNHPSAVEPYHGAATGVGGILRDIFTMGARPIAALDSLRFGSPENPQVRHLLNGIVHGIADYGNCFGVPTVGGEVYFEDSYEGNPLVNAMAVGLVKHGNLATASATGIGNHVVYVGSKTGRDGIHGATFASVELTEESEEKRTAVQVGDPFMEKLLLEATLEVIESKLVEGIQDMGAAGLTCSSSEMAGKAGTGIDLDVALVPQRETGMSAYEIMLSESQERMLMVVKPENLAKVAAIFEKWDLHAEPIGRVTNDGLLRVRQNGEVKAELPAKMLVLGGDAPVYERETARPAYLDEVNTLELSSVPVPVDLNGTLKKMMSSPNIADKHTVFSQYDHMILTSTLVEPGSDAAVVRIPGTLKAIALCTDCNGRHVYLNPYEGTKGSVAEAARNVACSGAKPLAITNCLNFGNPYKPEIYWTFVEAIRGMGDACRAFDTPVTGGNVSFYNENPTGAVYPTPTIGMLGLMEDYDHRVEQYFREPGDVIFLLGDTEPTLGGSEYLKVCHGLVAGEPPKVDLERERQLHETLYDLASRGYLRSAHDCADGGLAVALTESAFLRDGTCLGATVELPGEGRADVRLFGETHSRVIVTTIRPDEMERICEEHGCPCTLIGTVGGPELVIEGYVDVELTSLREAWEKALTR
jgi:phosphoribosylformylglycinamidine synthase